MALTRHTFIFLSIFALFFIALQSCNATSSRSPSLSSSLTSASDPAPASTKTSTSAATTTLFDLALPEIGVQKKVALSETEGSKVASKQLQAVERKISEFKAVLKNRLADPKTSQQTKTCLKQCQDNFEDAIEGVKTGIQSIGKHDLPKANADVSAVATDVDTCNDCFIQMKNEDPEIKAFDEWVRGITGDCLGNLKKG
ncbi:hypothetical protein SSX86_008459 [Deinandra increscens subsp. villosa]|uniref:Pectinesterase inhibitor domain-containing protein n=1 Tax=Deinandra increscens subsp. villosa TaxID=3103831 RepID=A0AAP0H530_9ASTR